MKTNSKSSEARRYKTNYKINKTVTVRVKALYLSIVVNTMVSM